MIRLSLPVLVTSLVTNIVYPGTVRKRCVAGQRFGGLKGVRRRGGALIISRGGPGGWRRVGAR